MKKIYKITLATAVAVGALAYVTRDTPQQKEAKHLRRGNEYFEKGEFLKARIEYKNAYKVAPTDPEIAYRWGLVDEAEGNIRNAFANFMAAEQQNPRYAPALKKLAHYMLAGNQNEMAEKRISTILADAPEDPEGRALKGAVFLRRGEHDRALKEALFALDKDPASITATSVLTGIYMAQKMPDKAHEALDAGIKRNPKDISLLMLKSSLYENPLNAAKLKETYEAVFAVKPKEAQFRLMLAQALVNAKLTDDAEQTLREAVTAIPDNWNLKFSLVKFLDQYRSKEVAEKEIQNLMKKYPENADLPMWLANLYAMHGDTENAIKLLQQVVEAGKDNKQGQLAETSIARISFIKGNKEMAENIVNAVLKKNPSNRDALFIRANLQVDKGLLENAVIDLRSVIRDDPKSKDSLKLLGEILLQQGYLDLAIDTMNQLVDLDPANPENRTRLSQLYGLNRDTKRALDQLKVVTETNPTYPVAWESIARIALSTKDYEKAKSAIEKLKTLDGQMGPALFLEGQLAEKSQKPAEAEVFYKKVVELDPKTVIAERALFAMVNLRREPAELEKMANYLASLKTDSPYVATLLGDAYVQMGKTELAIASYDNAIGNKPTAQDAFLNKAKILVSNKKYEEAVDVLKQASTDIPSDVRSSLMMASIMSNTGKHREAIEIYSEILNNKPQAMLAANNMASIISDQFPKDAELLERARNAVERFSNTKDPLMLDTIGWLYHRLEKNDKALSFLARAAASGDKLPPEIHYHYGVALLKAGKKEQARTQLTKAVAEGANYPALADAKKILAELK